MADVRTHYRENAARGASPVRQVIMLYEQVVEDLRRAAKAIKENSVEGRTNAINHAIVILGALQSRLNFEVGGQVARHLERFYNMARHRLIDAQFQASHEIIGEQIGIFLNLRDAWVEVDRKETERLAPGPVSPASEAARSNAASNIRADWRA